MRFRKLRIAWSVVCGIACALLIVLWVRSYWWKDFAVSGGIYRVHFESALGKLGVDVSPQAPEYVGSRWGFHSRLLEEEYFMPIAHYGLPDGVKVMGFMWEITPESAIIAVPYWFPILLISILAAGPWFRWRFSLRTLLIATTLVAVVLGLILWMSRAG